MLTPVRAEAERLYVEAKKARKQSDRYWQMYPPKGLTKLLPQGMRQPPRPIDDIVAILLIERYLNSLTEPISC